jgi:hypothetical protein
MVAPIVVKQCLTSFDPRFTYLPAVACSFSVHPTATDLVPFRMAARLWRTTVLAVRWEFDPWRRFCEPGEWWMSQRMSAFRLSWSRSGLEHIPFAKQKSPFHDLFGYYFCKHCMLVAVSLKQKCLLKCIINIFTKRKRSCVILWRLMRNFDLEPQMTLHAHNSFKLGLTLLTLKYCSVRLCFSRLTKLSWFWW